MIPILRYIAIIAGIALSIYTFVTLRENTDVLALSNINPQSANPKIYDLTTYLNSMNDNFIKGFQIQTNISVGGIVIEVNVPYSNKLFMPVSITTSGNFVSNGFSIPDITNLCATSENFTIIGDQCCFNYSEVICQSQESNFINQIYCSNNNTIQQYCPVGYAVAGSGGSSITEFDNSDSSCSDIGSCYVFITPNVFKNYISYNTSLFNTTCGGTYYVQSFINCPIYSGDNLPNNLIIPANFQLDITFETNSSLIYNIPLPKVISCSFDWNTLICYGDQQILYTQSLLATFNVSFSPGTYDVINVLIKSISPRIIEYEVSFTPEFVYDLNGQELIITHRSIFADIGTSMGYIGLLGPLVAFLYWVWSREKIKNSINKITHKLKTCGEPIKEVVTETPSMIPLSEK